MRGRLRPQRPRRDAGGPRHNEILSRSIAERLSDPFRLLAGGPTAAARHQTLRAAIDWSYELLGEPEQWLLRRLSVFAGGWTLEAADVMCGGEGMACTGWRVQRSPSSRRSSWRWVIDRGRRNPERPLAP